MSQSGAKRLTQLPLLLVKKKNPRQACQARRSSAANANATKTRPDQTQNLWTVLGHAHILTWSSGLWPISPGAEGSLSPTLTN